MPNLVLVTGVRGWSQQTWLIVRYLLMRLFRERYKHYAFEFPDSPFGQFAVRNNPSRRNEIPCYSMLQ